LINLLAKTNSTFLFELLWLTIDNNEKLLI